MIGSRGLCNCVATERAGDAPATDRGRRALTSRLAGRRGGMAAACPLPDIASRGLESDQDECAWTTRDSTAA